MEMILIREGSKEWEVMWNWLEAHPINKGIENPSVALNPLNDEIWKYQGSYRGADGTAIHEFLHRSFPTTNDFIELKVKASSTLCADDIAKIIPIK